ncbi:ABC transporter substrate-binding protein [Paenibacillus sp. GCM10012307]|uniref:ABC transporter substrate-binding protein n=1 Tax=Paenibacillus roseus TaxID=2798579 RepID=A0A934J0M5_9BACL|nr:ABC transporter substrate-binding protein [Paenibacillus roseus]MBJ6360555.1 ABC transporter substrate-binding protein [Paenibacillus roseus]
MSRVKKNWSASLLLLSLTLILAITGCSGAGNNSKSPENKEAKASNTTGTATNKGAEDNGQPVSGGELTFALAGAPDTLDPHRNGWATGARVFRVIYDNLVVLDSDNTVKPWLATEWTVSPDGKSYTFKLRNDVKFHDGTPLNAEAIKYNYDRAINPETKAITARSLLKYYESAEVIDEYTVKLNLTTPSQAFLRNLTQPQVGIISPTAAEKYGDQYGHNPVGTGPFKFVKWEENVGVTLERNDEYAWGPELVANHGKPYLDRLVFKVVPEEATRIGSVQSGQLLAADTVPPQNIAALKNDKKTHIYQVNTEGLPFTLFINQSNAPWNELKARQALQLAIDVEKIVKTLYLGTYDQAWSSLTPGTFGYDASLENGIKPDVDKANQLLDELGWVKGSDGIRVKDGKRLAIRYVEGSPNREKRQDIASIVQQQLKQIGIEVNINITKDIKVVVFENDDYDVYGNGQMNPDPEGLRTFYHSKTQNVAGKHNLGSIVNENIDKFLDEGLVETDPVKRAEFYKQAQQEISKQAIIIPIYVFPYTVAASSKVVDLKFDTLGYPLFNDLYLKP